MTECSICVETFNKTVHTKCECPHCNYLFCRTCIQTYILTIESYAISCMNCKKNWTLDTLDTYITKSFRNKELKEHREKVLIDRERSLLPATLPEVARFRKIKEHEEQLKKFGEEHRELLRKINAVNDALFSLKYRKVVPEKTTVHFSIHCPVNECKGFIESTSWECGLCKVSVCKKCHECKTDEEHICIEANVETAKLIKKDSKTCPGCATLIFKISGCNQMWCTQCHTTFLWTTGAIVQGNIHNPHYYEWMRTHNRGGHRTFGDVPCGGIISLYQLRNLLKNIPNTEFIFEAHRVLLEINEDELPRYRTDNVNDNQDLRVQFLMDKITEDTFKSTLQKREKKTIRCREIYDVLQMYVFTSVDLFNNLVMNLQTTLTTFEEDTTTIRNFANIQFEKISKRYNCVVPLLRSSFCTTKY